MELTLSSPVQYIPRVGPHMASLLNTVGIETVYDLLTYVPFRYKDYSNVLPIKGVSPGLVVTVSGTLESIKTFTTKNGKRIVIGRLIDDSGAIDITWFNQIYLLKVLHPGDTLHVSGKVDWFGNKIVFQSPEFEIIKTEGDQSLHTGRLVPVYPLTEGLSPKWLRGRIAYALDAYLPLVTDHLPEFIRTKEQLPTLTDAIKTIHFPSTVAEAERARDRLAYDEIFLLMLKAHAQKRKWQKEHEAHALSIDNQQKQTFMSNLPFTLTHDQEKALSDIWIDISGTIPMNRLLEGDVGSGKTVVAAGALYAAWCNDQHTALMAPTQILAQQHAQTLRLILEKPFGIPIHLVIGGGTPIKKTKKPAVYVGTHALLAQKNLPSFGLIAIDEQQRFGVNQRAALRDTKNTLTAHQLTMTATPIPRTIAQTVFGNIDFSELTTMPKGRKPVKTWLVPQSKRSGAYAWIDKELAQNHTQAFVICPLIDESESLGSVRAANSEYLKLKKLFPKHNVGLLHGRMKPNEKNEILTDFAGHRFDILVATPVVEVGIDIPDATIIVIEAADRFGLSQLHQLRGRVGRRDKPSYCLLFTDSQEEHVLTRLKALETAHNGPDLAQLDLSLRGPGELLGTRQHGVPGFTLAKMTDTTLIERVTSSVKDIIKTDPDLYGFPHLRQLVNHDTIDTAQS